MKHLRLLLLLILPIISSCSRHFYAPALYNNDISYQPKPASSDSAKSAGYISGGFGAHEGVSTNTNITFGELNLSQGLTFNHVNIAYGAYGFAGAVDNTNHSNETKDPNSFDTKGFGGIGGRFSINLFQAMDKVDFRFLGFEASYSKEFGDFAAFRKSIYNLPDYHTTTRTEVVTIGGTSEILWHSPVETDRQYAFRLFIGKTLGNYDYLKNSDYVADNPIYVAASFFMQVNRFFGVAEATRSVNPITGFRLKLGYRF